MMSFLGQRRERCRGLSWSMTSGQKPGLFLASGGTAQRNSGPCVARTMPWTLSFLSTLGF